jgi:histidinol-phosphate aminotransferase
MIMIDISILPTKHVSSLTPYKVSEGGRLSAKEKTKYMKLDWNEVTYPPSPLVREALSKFIETGDLNYYSDVTAYELRKRIADTFGLSSSFIQVFNGSDAALRDICSTYLDVNENLLLCEPIYSQIYPFVQSKGANLVRFTGRSPFEKVLDEYNRCLNNEKIRVVYIVNPNNPTGVLYENFEIELLLRNYSETLFVIDEAYSEFSGTTVAGLVKQYTNIIVTRTFSKAFGLAGLRIGYVLSQPKNIQNIEKIRNGKEISVLAQVAALAALEDIPYIQRRVEELRRIRDNLVNRLIENGIEVHTTPANFILIRVQNVPEVLRKLKEKGVLVRDRSYLPQLEGYIRVSIGLPDQMNYFFQVFTEIINNS